MGQPGDLLLIFADALIRSWKQIIKFRLHLSRFGGRDRAQRG